MSTGSASIPLLKAAPEPEQVEERLEGGPWKGIEFALLPPHVADDNAVQRAIRTVTDRDPPGMTLLAEAPVSWPSGNHVRVDAPQREALRALPSVTSVAAVCSLAGASTGAPRSKHRSMTRPPMPRSVAR